VGSTPNGGTDISVFLYHAVQMPYVAFILRPNVKMTHNMLLLLLLMMMMM
jgi:hypothetical protein